MKKMMTALALVLTFSATTALGAPEESARSKYEAALAKGDSMRKVADRMAAIADSLDSVAEDTVEEEGVFVDSYSVIPPIKEAIKHGGVSKEEMVVAIFAIFSIFLGPVLLVGLILYFIYGNRRQRYKLVEKAIESGQPLPKDLIPEDVQSDDLTKRKGIKNVFLGLGLFAFFRIIGLNGLGAIGVLLLFYGVGQLAIAYFARKDGQKRTNEEAEIHDDFQLND